MDRIKRQSRSAVAKFETREETGDLFISGYFSVFNSNYELWTGATESIADTAFAETLAGDIRCLIDHETRLVLGRTKAGTLSLKTDNRGLWGEVKINPNDQDAMNLYERVKRGDVDQCSFGFDILDEEFEDLGNSVHWTIKKVYLGFVTRLAQNSKPSDYLETAREWKNLSTSHVITGAGKTGMDLFKEIVTNTGVIDNDYSESGLAWIMNKKTHMKLMIQSMDKNMNAAIVAGIGTQMPIVGGDIVELNFIPDDNIAFGYLDMYLLAERAGTTLGQSEHVRFLDDQTVFKGTARYDGKPVIAEAFGVMSITTTAPKTEATFQADKANTVETEGKE